MKETKKGFTLAEIVIVLAVIAIMVAVLVPFVSAITRNSNINSDSQLVKTLNTELAKDKFMNGSHETMYDVVATVKARGYETSELIAAASDNAILWDSKNDLFCYLNDGEISYYSDTTLTYPVSVLETYEADKVNTADYFVVASEINATYSTYLYGYTGTTTEEEPLVISKGLDTGDCVVEYVKYLHGTNDEDDETDGQNVIIRTNGSSLTVDAPYDDVAHYGVVNELSITAVKTSSCYHEYGYVFELSSFGTGKFIAEAGAVFCQAKDGDSGVLKGIFGSSGYTEQSTGVFKTTGSVDAEFVETSGVLYNTAITDTKFASQCKHKVIWKYANSDNGGAVLKSIDITGYYNIPDYDGETPVLSDDYTFVGWSDDKSGRDWIYTAQFSEVVVS